MKNDFLHLDEFVKLNIKRSLQVGVGIYFFNVIVAMVVTLLYSNLFETDMFRFAIIFRVIVLLFLCIILYVIAIKKITLAKIFFILTVLFSIGGNIYVINKAQSPYITSYSIASSLIFLQIIIVAIFRNKYAILFSFLNSAILYYLLTDFVFGFKAPEINIFHITTYYLFFILFLFSGLTTTNSNRLLNYLDKLLYHDIRTGLYNQKKLEFDLVQMLQLKIEGDIIALDFRNLLTLNRQFGFRNIQPFFIERLSLIKERLSSSTKIYILEGSFIGFICSSEIVNELDIAIREPFYLHGHKLIFDIQWLGVKFPSDGITAEVLIDNLFSLKYSATSQRQGVRWFEQSEVEGQKRLNQLEMDLVKAIESKEIQIVFQPKYHLKNQLIESAEVLARWTHEKYGVISPLEFIPIVERLGLINTFTKLILDKSIDGYNELLNQQIKLKTISVNFSAITFMDESIYDLLSADTDFIEVELTESILLEVSEQGMYRLYQLKQHGIKLSIDDFGTGFSNLQYLHELDVDFLKIDKRFIDAMMISQKALKLVEALIDMSHTLGFEVIAEGVETKFQYDLLNALNCDMIQGYYFSKPLPIDQFIAFMKNQ